MTGGVSLGAGPKLGAKIYGGGGSAKWFCKGGVSEKSPANLVGCAYYYVWERAALLPALGGGPPVRSRLAGFCTPLPL